MDDEHGFIRFFKSLPAVNDDTIRIFDRGDWYTSHGEDANFIARTVGSPGVAVYLSLTATTGLQDDVCSQTARPK